jgi:ethanolamine utilization protein EutJ
MVLRRQAVQPAGEDSPAQRLAWLGEVMGGTIRPSVASGLRCGVDLGTACTVLVVSDGAGRPLAGAHEWTGVVRDGVVVDFHGAIAALRRLKADVEGRLGHVIEHAAAGFPPGVSRAEVKAVEHVLEAADLRCTELVDEPTAANSVLGITDGAVVDVGGGTTGIAIFSRGELVHVVDEPTGGVHATLVIAGALGLSLDEAELRKRDPVWTAEVAPLVRPVFEKIGAIVRRAIADHDVRAISLVGGTCRFPTAAAVIAEGAGVRCTVPTDPMFVTVLGLADADHDHHHGDEPT